MHHMYYGYGNPFWGFGLLEVLWHVLLIALIVWVIMTIFGGGRHRRWRKWEMWHSHSALSILNERFAKGEIDQKEYEERKKALMNDWHNDEKKS